VCDREGNRGPGRE